MSLNFTPLNVVQVRDPRTNINSTRDYAILRSGQSVLWKKYTTNSVSNTSIQLTCTPSAGNTIIQRKVWFLLPVRLTFVGLAPAGQTLLQAGYDAPRAFPISGSISNLVATINGESITINMGDTIHALMHFNTSEKIKHRDHSLSPTYPDQSQQYNDLFQDIKNPLASYGDCGDESVVPRGGFPMNIVANPVSADPAVAITAIVDVLFCEPLYVSPFTWGHGNTAGFININQMDFDISFYNGFANRMWSHDSASPVTIQSITGDFSGTTTLVESRPAMLFQYIQPDDLQMYSPLMPYTYSYFKIIRETTDFSSVPAYPNVLYQQRFTSNSLQITTIPRRTYVYMRANNNTLLSNANNTDTYFSIEQADLQFMNVNGIFASATKQQLYEMSVNNHIDLDWNSWSGEKINKTGSFTNQMNGVGSILCFEYGKDVALSPEYAPGVNGNFTFQITLLASNRSDHAIAPTMYVVHVYEGTFVVTKLGSATTMLGVVSKEDVLNASKNPFVDYKDVEEVNGGNFLSGLKNFGEKLLSGIKQTKAISKGLKALGSVPSPYAQIASQFAPIAESLGVGEGVYAGDGEGGRTLSRSALRRKLRK